MLFSGETAWFSKSDVQALLDGLDKGAVMDAITLCVKPGDPLDYFKPVSVRHTQWIEEIKETACSGIKAGDTGAVVFWSDHIKLLIQPPFPVTESLLVYKFDTTMLRQLLNMEYILGVILVRLGRYSVGVFQQDRLLVSKTGTRYVKGRHRAGGSSQRRFERNRQKQIREVFDKVCSVVVDKFGPYQKVMDYIILGGERITVHAFLQRCDFLRDLQPLIMKRILAVREPSLRELQLAAYTAWQSQVLVVQWPARLLDTQ